MGKRFEIILRDGYSFGIYDADTADEALDAMMRDANYPGGFVSACKALELDPERERRMYRVIERPVTP